MIEGLDYARSRGANDVAHRCALNRRESHEKDRPPTRKQGPSLVLYIKATPKTPSSRPVQHINTCFVLSAASYTSLLQPHSSSHDQLRQPTNNSTFTFKHTLAMDFVNKFTGGDKSGEQQTNAPTEQKQSGGFLGGIGDKLNSAAGGGKESEKNEDYLDKGSQSPSLLSC